MKKLIRSRTYFLAITLVIVAVTAGPSVFLTSLPAAQSEVAETDVLIVGAGPSGLSAALEALQQGARVTVIDMWSIFGGHGVLSGGVLAIVDTPMQRAEGIEDSSELAYQDFIEWGEDNNTEWVRFYVNHSRELIYDWVTGMGLEFRSLGRQPGNRVARIHSTLGGGRALVTTLYQECLKYPNVEFVFNHKVTDLVREEQRISGVETENLRTGEHRSYRASVVILATGGFQSSLELVRKNWPKHLTTPDRLLFSAGFNATGSGHELAQEAGGVLHYMDHQWNYSTGIPHPGHPGTDRGLSGGSSVSIWVNAEGERFVNESASPKDSLPAILDQTSSSYWAVFDDSASFRMSGTGWDNARQVLQDQAPGLLKKADSIEGLAEAMGLSSDKLEATVDRYNAMIDQGRDRDFGRFDENRSPSEEINIRHHTPQKIEEPPFYAVQGYPITRKSMGGVSIDLGARVVDTDSRPIPGLYAVGELTGLAQINGKAALEGTFLGPSIVTGRVAARSALADRGRQAVEISSQTPDHPYPGEGLPVENAACLKCHDLPRLVNASRRGYDHFERLHRRVLEERRECVSCHAEFVPVDLETHRFDRMAQAENCATCH